MGFNSGFKGLKANNDRYYNKSVGIIYNVVLIHSRIQLTAESLFALYVVTGNTSNTVHFARRHTSIHGTGTGKFSIENFDMFRCLCTCNHMQNKQQNISEFYSRIFLYHVICIMHTVMFIAASFVTFNALIGCIILVFIVFVSVWGWPLFVETFTRIFICG